MQSTRVTVIGHCHMNVKLFPFDIHTCNLTFGSFSYSTDDAEYFWSDGPVFQIFNTNLNSSILS